MTNKIKSEYCGELIYKQNISRHQKSEYNCKYCEKQFNRIYNKNEHELSCNAKDIYHKLELKEQELLSYKEQKEQELLSYKEQTKKELEYKDKLIEVKTNEADRLIKQIMHICH
jgi:hypothetical protein